MRKRKYIIFFAVGFGVLFLFLCVFFGFRITYKRPYRKLVQESGLDENLVYAVIKAESGFREGAVSSAGAVGLMQILPSTAKFVCDMNGVEFDLSRLSKGDYNIKIGCYYLLYLLERFPVVETALCAYNAGEGTVFGWLEDSACSSDGLSLVNIPYRETRDYVKKINKFRKIYEFLYG